MFGRDLIRKRRNETVEHFLARLVYLEKVLMVFRDEEYEIIEEYPREKKARADLVVLNIQENTIEVWVEVQETPLTKDEWKRKLVAAKCYKPKKIHVVLTEKSRKNKSVVKTILKQLRVPFKIFVVNTKELNVSEVNLRKN